MEMVNLIEKSENFLLKFYTLVNKHFVLKENWFFLKILFYLKYRYFTILENFYLHIYVLEGQEKYGKKNLKVLFCGNRNSLLYLTDLLFFNKPKQEYLGKNLAWKISKILNSYSHSLDLTILKTDKFLYKFFQKKGFVIIPEWISITLDISKPIEEIKKNFKKSAKEDLIKIKKYNYSYEATTDAEKFDHFFYKIRQEYFSKRVGEQALPGSTAYHDIRCTFNNGKLFLLKRDEKYVAGFIIVKHKNNIISPHFMGIIEHPYMDQAAGSALIYSFICWAKEQKFDTITFGLTRPFLDDGSLRFKRKWGMVINKDHRFRSIFALRFNNFENDAVYDFLEHNPFIHYEKNNLLGFIFLKETESNDKVQEITKKYYIPGLSSVIVIQGKEKLRNAPAYFEEHNNL
jgi:hypothetical protein